MSIMNYIKNSFNIKSNISPIKTNMEELTCKNYDHRVYPTCYSNIKK